MTPQETFYKEIEAMENHRPAKNTNKVLRK